MANNKNDKKCKNCATLNARIAELETQNKELQKGKPAPKPYTLAVGEDGGKSNAYCLAVAAGLLEEGESKTWATRKEYNKEFSAALATPEAAMRLMALYCKKGWNLEDLKAKVKAAKEDKEKAYKVYKQKAQIYKNLSTTQKSVKKAGLNAEQFSALLAKVYEVKEMAKAESETASK